MDHKKLAEMLFPDIKETPDHYEKMFPKEIFRPGLKSPGWGQVLRDSSIWATCSALLQTRGWLTSREEFFISE